MLFEGTTFHSYDEYQTQFAKVLVLPLLALALFIKMIPTLLYNLCLSLKFFTSLQRTSMNQDITLSTAKGSQLETQVQVVGLLFALFCQAVIMAVSKLLLTQFGIHLRL